MTSHDSDGATPDATVAATSSPVPTPVQTTEKDAGRALCLSGGGFRAMVFHTGAVRRLHELGLLDQLAAISSVSGGSIASGAMATHWNQDGLDLEAFETSVFRLAGHTIDIPSILRGWVRFTPVSNVLAHRYDQYLFDGRSIGDVPDSPQFIFNTTNMHSGNAFQWTKEFGHDYSIGNIEHPDVALSAVVAASSAFPPVLSPARMTPPGEFVDPDTGQPIAEQPDVLWLTDGGVYDNLGLQPVDHLETLLISDAGSPFVANARLRTNWFSLTKRTMSLLQDQVAKRRRYEELYAPGANADGRLFWSLRGEASSSPTEPGLAVTVEQLHRLAATHTRLAKLPTDLQYQLANLGYALTDHRVRAALCPDADPPEAFPYPGGLG